MTDKERSYKVHLAVKHQEGWNPECAPLVCDVCCELWSIWADEVLSLDAANIFSAWTVGHLENEIDDAFQWRDWDYYVTLNEELERRLARER